MSVDDGYGVEGRNMQEGTSAGSCTGAPLAPRASSRPAGMWKWVDAIVSAYRAGRPVAVLFDYDGTLTPIVAHPTLARLGPATRQRLAALSNLPGIAVGVISGRALADVRNMVGLPGLYYAGSGGQELDLRGEQINYPHADKFRDNARTLLDRLAPIFTAHPGTWAESKPVGIAIHYRELVSTRRADFRHEVARVVSEFSYPFRLLDVTQALEITPADGWDKGTAVEAILDHLGEPDVLPMYAGDAANDAEALAVVDLRGGIAIGVGPSAPAVAPHRVTDAGELSEAIANLVAELSTASCEQTHDPLAAGLLIVDPDAAGRAALAAGLRERGWRVWAVGTPDEARQVVLTHGSDVKILVVDLQLPGLQGARVLAELIQLQPELRRCVMSAEVDPYAAAAFRRMSETPLLTKPVRIEAAEPVLRSLLASVRVGS
jgi:trehalose 6-phosphate phosphatase